MTPAEPDLLIHSDARLARGFVFTSSWDDGHESDLRIAELLARYGLPGTFYIPRRAPHPVLLDSQISDLSKEFEVGAHTLNHVVLTALPDRTAEEEIVGSRRWIEAVTGRRCSMFCFPTGKFKRKHLAMVQQAGFSGCRTVEMMSLQPPTAHRGLAILPTTIQAYPHRASAYLRNLIKRGQARSLATWVRFGRGSWAEAAKRLLAHALTRGAVFHIWGHSWEIEKYGLWADLESVFRYAATLRVEGRYVTNSELCGNGARPGTDCEPSLLPGRP